MAFTFVKEIMKKNVVSMDESNSIQDAAQKMNEGNIGCVIITRENIPVGILTESDFVRIVAEGKPLVTELSGIMSSPLIVASPDDILWESAEIMRQKQIHKLPVQDKDKIIGIVTATDLVEVCSYGSDSQMRKICDQIMMRISKDDLKK